MSVSWRSITPAMKSSIGRIGQRAETLRSRLLATSSPVWATSSGVFVSFVCYLLSLFKRAPLPLSWILGIASSVALILAILDAGPGRQSPFARSVQTGLGFTVLTFADHARNQSESLTLTIVRSAIYGLIMALAFRFYIDDPREKKRSAPSSRPLN
jgi:hypothetical protein